MPATMRAAVYHGVRDVRVEQRSVPTVGDEDVLLAVQHCGICGTDLHNVIDGWGIPQSIGGHEYVGAVVGAGDAVDDVSEGAIATAVPARTCGACEGCRTDRPSLCRTLDFLDPSWQGGFAEFVAVHRSQLRPVPAGLDPRTAALAEPLAVALHAITRASVSPGDRVLVAGAGLLGLLAIAALRTVGCEVVASEPHPGRRDAALAAGATAAVTPDELAPPLLPIHITDEPYAAVLECSGRPEAFAHGLGLLRPGGTLVLVGSGLTPPQVDPSRLLLHELIVTGSLNYDADGFERALAMLASGVLPVDALLDPDDVPLDGLLAVIERLHRGEPSRKVLVSTR